MDTQTQAPQAPQAPQDAATAAPQSAPTAPTAPTMWNPIDAVKEKYPAMGLSDQQVYQNLSDPAKFRSAFPEYSTLQDSDIQNNMAKIGLKYPQYKMPASTTVGAPSTQPMQPSVAGQVYDRLQTGGEPVSRGQSLQRQTSGIEDTTGGEVATGALKGGLQTVHAGLRVANAVTGDNVSGLPTSFKQPDSLQPQGTAENIGYTAENIAEFLMGDELLKDGATAASAAPKVAKALEAIEKTPVLRNQIFQRMAREGFVGAAQGLAHTGDVKDAAEQGATMATMSGVSGMVGETVGNWLRERGFAGDVLGRTAHVLTQDMPSLGEVLGNTQKALDASEDAMHDSYDKFITGFRDKVGNEPVVLSESPLAKVANDIKSGTSLDPEMKAALDAATPATKDIQPLLDYITENPNDGMTGNQLIDLRQGLNKAIRTADSSIKPLMGQLLTGIDDTLDKLEGGASSEYATARGAYRDTLNSFKQPFVKAIREGKIADVANSITTGANPEYKIQTLRKLIGDDTVSGLGLSKFVQSGQAALDDDGQHIDVKKFVSAWRGIKQSVRDELFRTDPKTLNQLNTLVDNAKSISKVASNMKWGVRVAGLGSSIYGAYGVGESDKDNPVSPYAYLEIMGGLIGVFGGGKTNELTESLLTNRKVLDVLGKLGGYSDYKAYNAAGKVVSPAAASSQILGESGRALRGGIGANVSHIFNQDSGQLEPVNPQD